MIVAIERGLRGLCVASAIVAGAVSSTPVASRERPNQAARPSTDPGELVRAGQAQLDAKQPSDAIRTLQAAIEAVNTSALDQRGRDAVVARAEYLLGLADAAIGQVDDRAAHFARALALFERLDDDAGAAEAAVGVVTYGKQPFVDEERILAKAVPRARATGSKGVEADALHLWGDGLFTDGQYERAFHKLVEAEVVATAAADIEELGTIYNSLGRLYRNHGQLETALNYQLKALSLHEKLPESVVLVQSLNAVGVTYQAMGDHRRARTYLKRALDSAVTASSARVQDFIRANLVSSLIEQEAYEESARVLEGVIERQLDTYPQLRYSQLSEVYRLMGRYDAALDASHKAVAICAERDDAICFAALDERAEAHLARGNRAAALGDLNAGATMLERIRARLMPADFSRQNFGAAMQSWYSRTIEMQLADGLVRDALETAELARSRAFVDLLASRDLVMQEGARAARAATVGDLTRVATRLGSTLLMYWVSPTRLFIWTLAPDGELHSATVPVRESKLADLIRATSRFDGGNRDTAAWRQLYDLVIKPVRGSLPRTPGALVSIVPHGPLAMLSFAALQDARQRYLLEDFMLHYVPAGAVLDFTAGRRRDDARSSDLLVVADPSYRPKSPLDPQLPGLPGSRVEARAIAGLSPKDRVTVLEGDAATESRVRSTTAGKGVLHFATHAIVSDADPFNSFLALGGSATSPDDGTLTAQEIYGLKLQADVVVLSACRSGGGRVTGDGMATFARAFMYAGAPSLITSVWDVADESSAHLIPGFYRGWRGGASKARALRNAQLAFLRNLRAGTVTIESVAGPVVLPSHPALWAGFMLIGEPD